MTSTASPAPHPRARPETLGGLDDRQSAQIDHLLRDAAEAGEPRRTQLQERAVILGVPMARTLAARYRSRGVDADDLVQVATVGLLKAINGYVSGPDTDFRAYAMPTILGELRRHFRDDAWMVRPPRRIQDLQIAMNGIESELIAKLHRLPTPQDLAGALEVPIEQIVDAQRAFGCFHPVSLDAKLSVSSSQSLADRGPARAGPADRSPAFRGPSHPVGDRPGDRGQPDAGLPPAEPDPGRARICSVSLGASVSGEVLVDQPDGQRAVADR